MLDTGHTCGRGYFSLNVNFHRTADESGGEEEEKRRPDEGR